METRWIRKKSVGKWHQVVETGPMSSERLYTRCQETLYRDRAEIRHDPPESDSQCRHCRNAKERALATPSNTGNRELGEAIGEIIKVGIELLDT